MVFFGKAFWQNLFVKRTVEESKLISATSAPINAFSKKFFCKIGYPKYFPWNQLPKSDFGKSYSATIVSAKASPAKFFHQNLFRQILFGKSSFDWNIFGNSRLNRFICYLNANLSVRSIKFRLLSTSNCQKLHFLGWKLECDCCIFDFRDNIRHGKRCSKKHKKILLLARKC